MKLNGLNQRRSALPKKKRVKELLDIEYISRTKARLVKLRLNLSFSP
jgi:hypothetical protein